MATFSYNGWTASPNPDAIGINTEWEPIPGHRFPGGVKSGDVETILTYFVRQLDARVEPIDRDAVKDEWGWFFKQSANSPDLVSCHSSGTAFDYNATRHPNGHRGTWTSSQVATIREIQAEVSGVVRWLGDATRTPDEMHFEIRGTVSEVAAAAVRLRALDTPRPAPTVEATTGEYDDMHIPATIVKSADRPEWWVTDYLTKQHVLNRDHAKALAFFGKAKLDESGDPFPIARTVLDSIRTVA